MISDESNEKIKKLGNEYANALIELKRVKGSFGKNSKIINELQQQHDDYKNELEQIEGIRLESNDALMKVHKEIVEQNSKVDRAKRELKLAKKAMIKKVEDREYVRLFEVMPSIFVVIILFEQN